MFFSFENKNVLESILSAGKEAFKNKYQEDNVIPFLLKEDTAKHQKTINNIEGLFAIFSAILFFGYLSLQSLLGAYGFFVLIFLAILIIIIFLVARNKLQDLSNVLNTKLKYFLIHEDKVQYYDHFSLIGEYRLDEITVKPTKYLANIYIYFITCPNLTLGDCYIPIEDSMNLKNSFTFLGKPSYDDDEDNDDEKNPHTS